IHTANALRGFEVGRLARERGAYVVFGGIHASLYPEEAFERGAAHAVVRGDGDVVWAEALAGCAAGVPRKLYEGGRVSPDRFVQARWDLMDSKRYMWASVQTVRGCPKHCSFCSVWRTDGQQPRQPAADSVIAEIVALRRMGLRFIALADDNFYPVSLSDIALAEKRGDAARAAQLRRLREERFKLLERLSELPHDMVFFTQITMEAAEDPAFLAAMAKARIKGALVGVEAVTPEGLKAVFKEFNLSGEGLAARLRLFRENGVHLVGSFIFGLPSDRPDTFQATAELAKKANLTLAQFVMLTPLPGTVDFERWEKKVGNGVARVNGVPITRYWLIPGHLRPKVYIPHPNMSAEEIRARTQQVWDDYYRLGEIWKRIRGVGRRRDRLILLFMSKLYHQMYANTGIATDSARRNKANRWARWIAVIARKLFQAKPMPELQMPGRRDEIFQQGV
ncbi:MAG: B12-binding domain-containing radical SAM protein, partial [bacterium]